MKPDRMEARGVYDGYYRVGDRIEFRYSDLSPTGKSAVIKQVGTADAGTAFMRSYSIPRRFRSLSRRETACSFSTGLMIPATS